MSSDSYSCDDDDDVAWEDKGPLPLIFELAPAFSASPPPKKCLTCGKGFTDGSLVIGRVVLTDRETGTETVAHHHAGCFCNEDSYRIDEQKGLAEGPKIHETYLTNLEEGPERRLACVVFKGKEPGDGRVTTAVNNLAPAAALKKLRISVESSAEDDDDDDDEEESDDSDAAPKKASKKAAPKKKAAGKKTAPKKKATAKKAAKAAPKKKAAGKKTAPKKKAAGKKAAPKKKATAKKAAKAAPKKKASAKAAAKSTKKTTAKKPASKAKKASPKKKAAKKK